MAVASKIVGMAGSHMSSGASLMEGIGQEQAAKFEAKQMLRNAKSIEALGQQEAAAERLKGEELASTARARMAAGGGGMDTKTLGAISDRADYNALVALHNRYTEADIMQDEAFLLKKQGKAVMRNKRMGAVGSMLSGAGATTGSIASSYNTGGSTGESTEGYTGSAATINTGSSMSGAA